MAAVRQALSPERMGTYEDAVGASACDSPLALALYAWNAAVSGAFLVPLHVCEVLVRNAVSDALQAVYGDRWPWSATFERSLPDPSSGYSPRKDLQRASHNASTTSKVIPELTFVFWQKMFTKRHDSRIWDKQLLLIMPNLEAVKPLTDLRQNIYGDLEQIRRLRNRIAHHEPIFSRNLADDYQKILALVSFRSTETVSWLKKNQRATAVLAEKPFKNQFVNLKSGSAQRLTTSLNGFRPLPLAPILMSPDKDEPIKKEPNA